MIIHMVGEHSKVAEKIKIKRINAKIRTTDTANLTVVEWNYLVCMPIDDATTYRDSRDTSIQSGV